MKTITGKLQVFATENSLFNPASVGVMPNDQVMEILSFAGNHMIDYAGWTHLGEAEITVKFKLMDGMIDSKVKALRKKQMLMAAEFEAQNNQIEGQIQSLLALPAEV